MKKYKKNPTKLLQIRLSESEHEEITEHLKRFGVTHREWILAVVNELAEKTLVKDNRLWESHKEYAYTNKDQWDIQLKDIPNDQYKCEVCGFSPETRGSLGLLRHHHDGYEGDAMKKVRLICRHCHGTAHSKAVKDLEWPEAILAIREIKGIQNGEA